MDFLNDSFFHAATRKAFEELCVSIDLVGRGHGAENGQVGTGALATRPKETGHVSAGKDLKGARAESENSQSVLVDVDDVPQVSIFQLKRLGAFFEKAVVLVIEGCAQLQTLGAEFGNWFLEVQSHGHAQVDVFAL